MNEAQKHRLLKRLWARIAQSGADPHSVPFAMIREVFEGRAMLAICTSVQCPHCLEKHRTGVALHPATTTPLRKLFA